MSRWAHRKRGQEEVVDILRLTPMQEFMLYYYISHPDSGIYYEQILLEMEGDLNVEFLRQAWNQVAAANEALRSVFYWQGFDEPVQIVLRENSLPFAVTEMVPGDEDYDTRVQNLMAQDRLDSLDLSEAPLRVRVLRASRERSAMLVGFHHILLDGWSLSIVLREMFSYYDALCKRKTVNPLPRKPPLSAYYAALRQCDKPESREFWARYLLSQEEVVRLGLKEVANPSRLSSYSSYLGETLQRDITDFCRKQQFTQADVLYCAWGLLLQKYNNTDNVIFGTTVSGRTAEIDGAESITGLFINTLPMCMRIRRHESILELLRRTSRERVERDSHQYTPLTEILAAAGRGSGELFSTLVVIDNYPLRKQSFDGGRLRVVSHRAVESTHYEMTLQISTLDGIGLCFLYDGGLFTQLQVERLGGHLINILGEMTREPHKTPKEILMLGKDEAYMLREKYNQTQADLPDCTLHARFMQVARQNAERTALKSGDACLTYSELDCRSDTFAALCIEQGACRDEYVAIYLPRSSEMVIAILGVLKAGCICVPLDMSFPASRIEAIMEDCGAAFVVESDDAPYPYAFNGNRITSGIQGRTGLSCTGGRLGKGSDGAFLLYTTGSTGTPKGTVLHHKGVLNHCLTKVDVLGITPQDCLANTFSSNVVAAVWQIMTPLMIGGRLNVFPQELEFDLYKQVTRLAAERVNFVQMIPSQINTYLELIEGGEKRINLPYMKKIAVTSEALPPAVASRFYQYYDIPLVNCYGQTECCDDTLHYELPVDQQTESIPIGTPSRNTRTYILDRFDRLQPVGVSGELCICGEGVTAGYLHKEELNKEKFIPSPFIPDTMMYRTGDLARWREDGNVECLGRLDYQVKIRGNRIELGEIEHALMKDERISEAAVLAITEKEGRERYLVAYVVAREEITVASLRKFLSRFLPDYSIPSHIVQMENIPRTPNGKIDRKALLSQKENMAVNRQRDFPQSEIEKTIQTIWLELLDKNDVGIRDNFFDAGGHSLLLLRLHSKLSKRFDVPLSVVDLLQYTTISMQAELMSRKRKGEDTQEDISTKATNEDGRIAVVGMAGRFPKANTIRMLWRRLQAGEDCVSTFSQQELAEDSAIASREFYVPRWGAVDDVELFDADFFHFSPREAELMDPQQRIFFECAWEALEDAGHAVDRDRKIGVFASTGISTYLLHHILTNPDIVRSAGEFQIGLGNDKDFIGTKTAYRLNLNGPAVTIQTACSSSLAAVHMACQSLLNGECDSALAGGVYIRTPQNRGYVYEVGGNASPDGYCKTFDASANGAVMGNGAGVVLLKRLKDALENRDCIYAVIRGSAINNDGAQKVSYTAASVQGQAEVIAAAQAKAGISPSEVSYIEAHGTGTGLGDGVELAALQSAFHKTACAGHCALGSIKTLLGHLDVAAGITGFIKTALCLYHKQLTPTLNFALPTDQFDLISSPFYIQTELDDWQTDGKRVAGVSSFGIGGTNVHVVMEECPDEERAPAVSTAYLLPLSARTKKALGQSAYRLYQHILHNKRQNLADIGFTLQQGRAVYSFRRAICCEDRAQALRGLRTLVENCEQESIQSSSFSGICVLYGEPPERIDMEWYDRFPAYRDTVDRCESLLRRQGQDISACLRGGELPCDSEIRDLVRFIAQLAFAHWLHAGIVSVNCSVGGVGIGKATALCLCGCIELEEAFRNLYDACNGKLPQVGANSPISYLSIKQGEANTGEELNLAGMIPAQSLLETANRTGHNVIALGLSHPADDNGYVLCSLAVNDFQGPAIAHILGTLWEHGCDSIEWDILYPDPQICRRTSLPTYPFERKRYWIDWTNTASHQSSGRLSAPKSPDMNDWFYIPFWKPSALPVFCPEQADWAREQAWILFADEYGMGRILAESIRQGGGQAVLICMGERYEKTGPYEYRLCPQQMEEYTLLFQDILSVYIPTHILHAWGMHFFPNTDAAWGFHEAQYRGYYSVLYLVKALYQEGWSDSLHLWVTGTGIVGGEGGACFNATLTGLCKVVTQEHTNITCRLVELDKMENNPFSSTAKIVEREIQINGGNSLVRYQNGYRYLPDYERLPLRSFNGNSSRIRQGGTYLLIGGTGRIGAVLARYLARQGDIKLVLVGRTLLSQEEGCKIYVLLEQLRQLGAEADYMCADVGNPEEIAAVVRNVRETGEIDGVFYLAGYTGEEAVHPISEENIEHSELHFAKIYGFHNLLCALSGKEKGFCIVFSSLCAVLGGLGSAAYASANAYTDALAVCGCPESNYTILSANSEAWEKPNGTTHKWLALDQYAISDAEGEGMFEAILRLPLEPRRLIISTGDLQLRGKQWGEPQKDELPSLGHYYQEPVAQADYFPPRGSLDRVLCGIWQELLGVKKVGIRDNFFDLGGHSLIAVRMMTRLRSIFLVELSLRGVFESPWVEALSDQVIYLCGGGNTAEQIASLYEEVYDLPVDKAKERL